MQGDGVQDESFLRSLEDGTLLPQEFGHRSHLRAGFLYLARHDFPSACVAMKRAITAFAERIGKASLYHETLTIAFLALIAERRAEEPDDIDFERFIGKYPELEDLNYFRRYYPLGTLDTPESRRTFVLPRARSD
jgi:hypothetical protein